MGRRMVLVLGVVGLVLTLGPAVSGADWPDCTNCTSSNLKVLEAEIVETESCNVDNKRTGDVRIKLDTNQTYSVRVVGEVFYSGIGGASVGIVNWCTQTFSATAFVTVLSGLQWDCDKGLVLTNVLVGWDSDDLCGGTPDCGVIQPHCNDDDYGTTFAIAGTEPANTAPVVADIPNQTIAEGSTFATINLDGYVTDVDNTDAEMTWTYAGNTDFTVTIDGSRVATIGIPNADWNGAETITFTATDPGPLFDSDAATFTITAVNDAPTGSDSSVTTNEDTAHVFAASDFGYSDADGDSVAEIQITSLETVGDLKLSSADVTSSQVVTAAQLNAGDLTYTPLPDGIGTPYDTFRFKVHDGTVYSASDNQLTVNVAAVNDPPIAIDDEASTLERTSVLVDVVSNDTDPEGDALQVVSVTTPSSGSATITGNQVLYTPPYGFVGDATFTYTIRDSGGQTATGTVTVTVISTNSPPRADAGGLYRGMVGDIIVLDASFSTDPDIGDLLQYRWDVTGDGVYNTTWLDVPQHEMTFGMAYRGSVKLEVRDLRSGIPNGTSSTDEAIIIIEKLTATLPIGDHLFEFLGVVYNDDGTSTWTYRVTSGGGPSLSHWTLGFGDCLTGSNVVSADETSLVGDDPTTGIYGIKFDEGYEDDEVRTLSFTMDDWYVAESSAVAAKAGNRSVIAPPLPAPGCGVVEASTGIRLEKSVSRSSVTVGDYVAFTVIVINDGSVTATGVAVADQVPSGLAFVSASPSQGSYNDLAGVWTIGTLPASGVATLEMVVLVEADAALQVENRACAYADQEDQNLTNNCDNADVFVNHVPILNLEKTGPISASMGDSIVFGLTLSHSISSDGSPITNLQVTDSLAGEAVYLSGDDGDGLLEAGEVWTYEALYTVQPNDPDPLVNTATATGQDLDGDFVTGEASHSLSSSADMSIEKSDSPDPVHVGAELIYSVIVANRGPSEAINIQVVDVLPANLLAPEISFDTTSWESWDGTLFLPSLGVNETIRFLVRGTASTPGVLTNVIEVQAETPDPDMSNNRATELTTVVTLADLEIRKTDSADPVSSGEIFEYRIEVRNNGPDTAREVTVRETMPTSIVWLGYETTTGSYDPIYGVWTVGDLAVGETASLTFTVQSDPVYEGVLVNQVDVSSQTPDPVTGNNSSIERTAVVGSAGGGGGVLSDNVPCERLVPNTDRIWFRTDYAMYCASEFERLAGLADSSAHRMDTLLPTWVRTTKERGQIVAFDNVIQVNAASGLGIEMSATAPHDGEGSWESRLQGYAEIVGLPIGERPLDERWVMLEYVGGDPRFVSRKDDLWPVGDWAVVDQRISPSALGMGLLGQVQEAEALLGSSVSLEQYLALALTDVMTAKLVILDEQMALALSGADLGGGGGAFVGTAPIPGKSVNRYFAESYYARSEPGGGNLKVSPVRPDARLFDHVALLMGLTAFAEYSDPSSSELFGDGLLFAPEYHELATKLRSEVLSAIEVLFTDTDGQVWSEAVPDTGQRSTRLTTDLGLLLASLADVARSGDSEVKDRALSLLVGYADYLLEEQEDSGAIRSDLSRESSLYDTWELGAQAAAIRGFVAAFEETGDSRYLHAAEASASFVDEFLWDEGLGVYAGALLFNRKEYCYSSLDVGLVMGALRSLAVADPSLAGDLLERASRFFRAIVDEADLQLPEDGSTGTFGEFSGSGAGRISGLQVADAPLGVAPVLQERFCLEQDSKGEPCCGIDVAPEPWYQTDIAMYASFEMQDVAPWAEDYADANLASLVLHSSMGVALTGFIAQSNEVQLRLLELAEVAGLPVESIPAVEPLVLEYESGSPRLDDIDQLAWDESSFYKRVTGSSLGMTLLRESQEALQLLGGGSREKAPVERFYGLLLVDALCKKIDVIEKLMQIMLSHTATAYVPHAFRLTEASPGEGIDILDPRSGLFDQSSLLWGLQQTLRVFQDPNVMTLLAETELFDRSITQRTADLVESVLQTIANLHLREGSPSLVDWTTPTPTGWEQAGELQAVNLGLTAVALAEGVEEETNLARELLERVMTALTQEFLAANGKVTVQVVALDSASHQLDTSARKSLSAGLAAIRGLLAAYEQTNDPTYIASAQRIFDGLISGTLHKTYVQTPCGEECYYAGSLLEDDGCYSPLEVGLAIGALERLARVSESDRAIKIREVLDSFFEQIVESARLQLPSSSIAQDFGGRNAIIEYFAPVLARRVCYPSPVGK